MCIRDSRVLSGDPDRLINSDPRFLDFSLYSAQVQRWYDFAGKENVLVVRFEDYVANRFALSSDIASFANFELRQDAAAKDLSASGANRVAGAQVAPPIVRRLLTSDQMQRFRHGALGPLDPPLRKLLLRRPSHQTDIDVSDVAINRFEEGIRSSADEIANSYLV